jgi:chitinase
MVSYEDPRSIAEKGAFVKAQGLGGAILWTINQGRVNGADPLTKAAYSSIVQ